MKILVLNGSPKGEYSITLQYARFIQKKFPQHELKVLHISKPIKKIEGDEAAFREIIDEIRSSDGVLWIFGLWVLGAPAQYMRFIELVSERGAQDAFRGKYAAVLTTSIHYFDHLAHDYMRAVCEDMGMRYVEGLSLGMRDLNEGSHREVLGLFAGNFFDTIAKKAATSRLFRPLVFSDFVYHPSAQEEKIDNRGKKVIVLTDGLDPDTNLGKMIGRFEQSFSDAIEVIDLDDIDIRSACMGCMRCGYDYNCVQKDGFTEFYNNRLRTADIIVFAGAVVGRHLSSVWKTFYDRAFFWNHTPSLVGKQLGYMISGPLSQNASLVKFLEASSIARQDASHVDIITDESEDSEEIDALLRGFAERLVDYSVEGYIKPKNFLGVGGHKIFRDDIWGHLRVIWQADHRYYKKHGKYDFPQKDLKTRMINLIVMTLTRIPRIRKEFYSKAMIVPRDYIKKIVDKM